VAVGWVATLAKFKPAPVVKKKEGTVGEVIAAASQLATTRPQSFAQAVLRLRQLAGEIAKVKRPEQRTSYRSPAFVEWRSKVDSVPLAVLTGDAVRAWRDKRIAARSKNPLDRRAATISADSTIRMARAVFSKRILSAGLGSKVSLPSPLPFAGVTVGGSTKRFSERINAAQLFAAARAELETTKPEVFRAFALCILAGLRRSEADRLAWAQVDLGGKTISIERTEWFDPKSEESARVIDLDDVAVEIIRRAKADAPDPVFVLKGSMPKPQTKAATVYRADVAPWRTWETLVAWLAAKGVQDGKPIHVLRKLAGSLVFAAHGLEQARGFLGHASISTTSDSYLAASRRVTVSIAAPTDELSIAGAAKSTGTEGAQP
jgi:integrase